MAANFYNKVREEAGSVTSLCKLAEVSRAGYYRFLKPVQERAEEMELRDAIQKIAVEMPTGNQQVDVLPPCLLRRHRTRMFV